MQNLYLKVILVFTLFCNNFSSFCQDIKKSYGDKGCMLNYSLLDNRFPAMKEWAKAGVENGIPDLSSVQIVKKISPKDDLQQSINEVFKKGGVLLLTSGEYIISRPVNLLSGVIIRGTNKEKVLLSVKVHGYQTSVTGKPRQSALILQDVKGVGIENLTIKYTGVDFEPNDRNSSDSPWEKDVFHIKESRDTTLFVEQIWINQSKNCWVQDCNILWAGSDPIRITSSEHITCRRNFIDRCYNKNDGGMGYYNILNSKYVLICNEKVKRIRHLAIQNNSKYNVIINNDLEVDINFHNGDDGYNLIENNIVKIPVWHSWKAVSRGDLKQHQPPGVGNILFNNLFCNKDGKLFYSTKGTCYQMNSLWNLEVASPLIENLQLTTLYPVK